MFVFKYEGFLNWAVWQQDNNVKVGLFWLEQVQCEVAKLFLAEDL